MTGMDAVERKARVGCHLFLLGLAEETARSAFWEAVTLAVAADAVTVDELAERWLHRLSPDEITAGMAEHEAVRAVRLAEARARQLVDKS